jgi:hypothetical protein
MAINLFGNLTNHCERSAVIYTATYYPKPATLTTPSPRLYYPKPATLLPQARDFVSCVTTISNYHCCQSKNLHRHKPVVALLVTFVAYDTQDTQFFCRQNRTYTVRLLKSTATYVSCDLGERIHLNGDILSHVTISWLIYKKTAINSLVPLRYRSLSVLCFRETL